MKRILSIIMICGLISATAQDKPKIAVFDFKAGTGMNQSEVDGIVAMLTLALFDTQAFTLVERTAVDKAIEEQGFQKASLSNEQVLQIGSVLGVKKTITGEINMSATEYLLDVRIIDVETGVLLSNPDMALAKGALMAGIPKLAERLAGQMIPPAAAPATAPAASSSASGEVITLYGYLRVFPEDLGEFSAIPSTIIAHVNKATSYGYHTWRVPTMEELELIRSNRSKISGLADGWYWSFDKGAMNFSSGLKITAAGNCRIRLVTTGQTSVAIADKTAEIDNLEAPPHAASSQKWPIEGNGISQVWSDAIEIPACKKIAFDGSRSDCRNNPGYKGYLYSWSYVSANADLLCPSPWRVPEKDDFVALDFALRGAETNPDNAVGKYLTVWGGVYSGFAGNIATDRVYETGSYAEYWSSTESGASAYKLSLRKTGYVNPQETRDKRYGLQVRCVK